MQYPNLTATEAYYYRFAQQYGFADHELRGHGHSVVRAKPVSDHFDDALPDSYCKDGTRHSRGVVRREAAVDSRHRFELREKRALDLLERLRQLVPMVRNRIESRPTSAAREALHDAELLLNGEQPLTDASRLDTLVTLSAILARYA